MYERNQGLMDYIQPFMAESKEYVDTRDGLTNDERFALEVLGAANLALENLSDSDPLFQDLCTFMEEVSMMTFGMSTEDLAENFAWGF